MLTPVELRYHDRHRAPPVSRQPGPLLRALLATLASATILTLSLAGSEMNSAGASSRAAGTLA